MIKQQGTLLLTRSQMAHLLSLEEYIEGIEDAFRIYGQGEAFGTDMIHGDTPGELEFHVKSGGLRVGETLYYGLKINASCFSNMLTYGLPNIMGAIILFEAVRGIPLAIVDSIEPTIRRTAAGTAVAAKYLATPDAKSVTICGCGNQGRMQLTALKKVLPIDTVFAFDKSESVAKAYAKTMGDALHIPVEVPASLEEAVAASQVVVCCTPSKKPYMMKSFVRPGTFIAAIGSDSPDKQELEAGLLQDTKVVVDIAEQCAEAGELNHGLESGLITMSAVHAEIGHIISGEKPGREDQAEIIVYDATGTALQDTAAVALCYEKAVRSGIGQYVKLSG